MRPLKQAIYSSRTADKFVVRLPDGMRERIAEAARTHHRSMNSEIIARLEVSLNAPEDEPHDETVVAPCDPWTPIEGMMVAYRSGPKKGKADKILSILGNGKGGFHANLANGDTAVKFNDLMPFIVK